MTNEEFLKLIEEHFNYRKSILCETKKSRTSGAADRLVQFKRMAAMRRCTAESAAIDLCTKHFTDIIDMANGTHPNSGDLGYFEELISDVQNYLDLALAIATEKIPTAKAKASTAQPIPTPGQSIAVDKLGNPVNELK